ncbi:hypothetical protein BH11MYX1_BH11MYX1_19370 [soil metagenome]
MVIGTQLGAYRIIEQIGAGGMGSVYRAQHVMLGREAAVKVLHPEYNARPEVVTRFFNEARAATQVADPGIVQLFDFGHHTDGSAYIVMELLVGEGLDHRLDRIGAFPIVDALRVMRQVASSLGAAHARGIVHRDLKPDNIYLCRDPEVAGGERAKVLDFGIAKLTQDNAGQITNTQAVIGTPMYMSPEQCRGAGRVDQRSDIYSLGCVLSKLLTGVAPFEAAGTGELIVMHMQMPPSPPSLRASGVSPELDTLVLRCLDKNPDRRFANGTELAAAIEHLLGSSHYPSTARVQQPQVHGIPAPTTLSGATGVTGAMARSSLTSPRASRKRALVIAGSLFAVGATLGIVIATTGGDAKRSAETPIATQAMTTVVAPPVTDTHLASTTQQLATAVTAFKAWATAHPSDACPPISALSSVAPDAWATPLVLTCTEQPGDQIVGVTSAGPDRVFGTADDLQSWTIASTSTLAHGARWTPTSAAPVSVTSAGSKPPVIKKPPITKPRPPTTDGFVDLDCDGIPDRR